MVGLERLMSVEWNLDIVAGITAIIMIVIWLLRLESRVNVQDSVLKGLIADITEIKADVKALLMRRKPRY